MNQQNPPTDEQLNQIEATTTDEHLTPGPWDLAYESCDCGGDYPCGHGPYVTGVITPVPTSIAADRCKRTGEEPRDYDFHRGEIGDFTEADWVLMVSARHTVPALLAEVRRLRDELSQYEVLNPQQCPAGKHADWLVDSEYTHACPWCRIAELEGPAVEARAALAALCYDLEDPGSNALGALYLLSQATLAVDAPRDDTNAALLRHACKVLHGVADIADPEPPEVSFFGPTFGPQVAGWLRMLAEQPAAPASAAAVSGGEQQ